MSYWANSEIQDSKYTFQPFPHFPNVITEHGNTQAMGNSIRALASLGQYQQANQLARLCLIDKK